MQELSFAVTYALLVVTLRYVSQMSLARIVLDKAVNDVERTLLVQSPACKMQLEAQLEH